MAGWLHGVSVGDWFLVFLLCGFSLSLFCNYLALSQHVVVALGAGGVIFLHLYCPAHLHG